MSLRTFEKALALDDEVVAIGGGEPTVHPRFWEFLCLAIAHYSSVWLATNGKRTDTALALAKMAKKGVISCDLSLDCYHEEIDKKVRDAFVQDRRVVPTYGVHDHNPGDLRSIRDVTASWQGIIASGRGAKVPGASEGCPCEDPVVRPNGFIYQCGCLDAPKIGDVNKGYTLMNEEIGCHKTLGSTRSPKIVLGEPIVVTNDGIQL